ncbi:MAG: (d)CMP kinase, partial [Thermoleophilia bacterium]|nr:(d)CMP kinase [Thermoleophilia bacterium]
MNSAAVANNATPAATNSSSATSNGAPSASGGKSGPGLVIAIFGPTGTGKTAVAVEVARRLDVRVISCDSMQVYRGFPVLTNQPTAEETQGVPHALVGC